MVRFLTALVVALLVASSLTAACGGVARVRERVVHREHHVQRVGLFHRAGGAGCVGVVGAGCQGSVGAGCQGGGILVVPMPTPPKATQLPADPPKK